MQNQQVLPDTEAHRHDLNIRIEEVGWAVFLIMIGGMWLMPEGIVATGTWLVGAGLIMLGINFARFFMGLKMSGFTVFLGILALVAGLSGMFNFNLPIVAALFIIFGVSLLMRALFKKRD